MTALIPFVLVGILVLALVIWGVSYISVIPANIRNIIIGILILLFAYVIALKAGLL